MFINLSNHSSEKWSETQLSAANEIDDGGFADMSFPQIDPSADEEAIDKIAAEYIKKIERVTARSENFETKRTKMVVHLMGEMGFVVSFIAQAPKEWTLIHSTTERKSVEKDGVKTSVFEFVQFRKYRR